MHNFIIGPCDTDSISFCKADMTAFTKEELQLYTKEINDLSPEFMDWAEDGYYDACLALKAKNYVLVQGDKYTYRGSSLRDNKKELALKEMLHKLITDIIENESKNLNTIYLEYIKEAMNIQDITRWVNKKTVTKSVLQPERLTEQKVLDAINKTIELGIIEGISEGDKVWLYNAIDGEIQASAKGEPIFNRKGEPKMIPNYILKDSRIWDGQYDQMHYVSRVYSTLEILSNVLSMDQFVDFGLKRNSELLKEIA